MTFASSKMGAVPVNGPCRLKFHPAIGAMPVKVTPRGRRST
jgi:hypothetical protein